MPRNDPIPLRTFVYRTLAFRLALATTAIVLAVLAITYLHQRSLFEQQVADIVRSELALLMDRAARLASVSGGSAAVSLPAALRERLAVPTSRTIGRFVYLWITSPDMISPIEVVDPDYAPLGDVKLAITHEAALASSRAVETSMVRPGDKLLVRVVTPVPDMPDARAELLFAVSPHAIVRARAASMTAMAVATGIVLATALLLYPVILRLVGRLANFSDDLLEANFAALSMLGAAIAIRDSDTDTHNYRVTIYALRLGEAARLPPDQMQSLLKGSFLHDVGKIGIRDNVLLKPGRLTEEEFTVMRTHVELGVALVRRSSWLADAATIVGAHHEKVDGSGYPQGAQGTAIPIIARIFAIADVFDALTSRRPYKEPMTLEASIAILEQGRDRHFDGKLLDVFLAIAPELYGRYGGREDEAIKREVEAEARRHFRSGLDTLAY
jgi:HD-GYP domain-containing protein (c-di-GMP phosphodiesterase class II)